MKYHAEILFLVDAVVTGDEVKNGKPAPDIFLEAARRLGCDPGEAVYAVGSLLRGGQRVRRRSCN